MKINRKNIGYEHNQLLDVAQRLIADGAPLGQEYKVRYVEEQNLYDHLTDLGKYARRDAGSFVNGQEDWKWGADIADWLMARGWQPTSLLESRVLREEVES